MSKWQNVASYHWATFVAVFIIVITLLLSWKPYLRCFALFCYTACLTLGTICSLQAISMENTILSHQRQRAQAQIRFAEQRPVRGQHHLFFCCFGHKDVAISWVMSRSPDNSAMAALISCEGGATGSESATSVSSVELAVEDAVAWLDFAWLAKIVSGHKSRHTGHL